MAPYTQEGRLISLATPLGKDVLLLTGFKGTEAVSHLFRFELDLFSSNAAIAFEDIIGKRATVKVELAGKGARYFNGVISRFSQTAGQESEGGARLSHYRATLVPWTWLLTRTSDARIFQNLSVPDILDKIFKEKGFSDVSMELQGTYSPREYCVQYRETDFSFISRLMEEEGIYYYFTHSEKTHTMVIADASGSHKKLSSPVRHHRVAGARIEEDTIAVMEKFQEVQAGKYTLNDFNYEIPNTSLKASMDSGQKIGPGEREMYDYPGGYAKKGDGDRLARLRMEQEEARITTISGSGNCREFSSGHRFALKNALRPEMNDKEYVLTSVSHEASQPLEKGGVPVYRNGFTCIPFEVPFRPPLVTPKPMIHGSQTAIVVGKSGEEIYTDKFGRVKVQFHWDREGKKDENASCWIRVGQIWAGSGWGAVWIPRIGHEVIVSFLEGDPDRPLITGSVYDGANMPPYSLPAEMTRSTIKSNSSKGGGGFNELRFEDKKGAEEVYLQGQKDWNILILNNKSQNIGVDDQLSVGNNQSIAIGANRSESVGINESITIGSNKTETVAINKAETIGAAKELTIGGAYQITVGGLMNTTVGGAKAEEVGAYRAELVGGNKTENIGGKKDFSTGKDYSITVGKNLGVSVKEKGSISVEKELDIGSEKALTLKAKEEIVIQSDKEIVLKSGSAQITLKKNGDIEIKGNKINLKGSGDIKIKGSKVGIN